MSQFDAPMQPQPQYQYPAPYAGYATRPRTDGAAVTVLVLAIASLFFWIVPAIVALALAPQAKKRIKQGNGALRGNGVALAGQIVASISLAIGVLAFVLIAIS